MGYEVYYTFHARKEEGVGYEEQTQEKVTKVGKPFDDTPMEKLAAAIMAQLARRDIWIIDVKIFELVKKEIAYKECKDGRGITLKNKRYSFNEAAQMIAEDCQVSSLNSFDESDLQPHELIRQTESDLQPHELIRKQNFDDLYSNPNKSIVATNVVSKKPINKNKSLYKVTFEPNFWEEETKRLKLKLTLNKVYDVHAVVPHPTGNFEMQKIAITDDVGRVIEVSEKYFCAAGQGLLLDQQLDFSGNKGGTRSPAPKLSFENEMQSSPVYGRPDYANIPVDTGVIPAELMEIPDIRAKR